MKRRFLLIILTVARWTGLFALSRWFTRRDLRILCYHGAAVGDESEFRPSVFMTGSTFAARMQFLDRGGYKVLPLEEALERLESSTLPSGATVITIDDGWYGTYRHQIPVLVEHNFPATLYVASYYVVNQFQVFNVALQYVVWKSRIRELDLSTLELGSEVRFPDAGMVGVDKVCEQLVAAADRLEGAAARQALLRAFCDGIGFDWQTMEDTRQVAFMSLDEVRAAAAKGIDLQLHTHRHRFPTTGIECARREFEDNRAVLEPIAGEPRRHFCYPSGEYTPRSLRFLPALGIESATTTKPGFNRKGDSRLELKRFLDGENISELEFAAEMSGFFELVRRTGYRT